MAGTTTTTTTATVTDEKLSSPVTNAAKD